MQTVLHDNSPHDPLIPHVPVPELSPTFDADCPVPHTIQGHGVQGPICGSDVIEPRLTLETIFRVGVPGLSLLDDGGVLSQSFEAAANCSR